MTEADDIIRAHKEVDKKRRSKEEMLEVLADVQHEIWSSWMRWLFSQCYYATDERLVIPDNLVERWQRQMGTPYAKLSEREKDSDRDQAKKVEDALVLSGFSIK